MRHRGRPGVVILLVVLGPERFPPEPIGPPRCSRFRPYSTRGRRCTARNAFRWWPSALCTSRAQRPEASGADAGCFDADGFLTLKDRSKDMIISGGSNIYPREIEEFLYHHPKILDVQVVGVPDEKSGEEAMAWVRLKDGQTATPEEIRGYCQGKISRFKIPKYVTFCDGYPMTASGKVQKFKLREQALEIIKGTESIASAGSGMSGDNN